MTDADNLYQQHQAAVKYIYKIGAPQHHFRDGSVGRLIKCEVNTEICHQSNPSAQNYWSDAKFDCALSEVIKEHFTELAQAALNLLKKKADEALVAEKKELQERLARIEALEKEMGA